jgi:nucleoside-diphosphate-sugar epimerase
MSTVLVTGGSGFIGCHCILQLLTGGYQVRTTVRNLNREPDVRAMLKVGGAGPDGRVSFVAADLEKNTGWPDAIAGCEYVLHVASPFPDSVPKHEDELIVPAWEGTLRVLRAARDAFNPFGATSDGWLCARLSPTLFWFSGCAGRCRYPRSRHEKSSR